MSKTLEVIKTVGNFSVIKYYANTLYTDDDKENGVPYYGDVYTSQEDVLKDHPDAEVMEGFGVHDNETGFAPDDAEDWYDTVDEAMGYIENQ